jgi:hypothetical protein
VEGKYSVWTRDDSPEWLDQNAGCPDVLLVFNITIGQAEGALERLKRMYDDEHLEIRLSNQAALTGSRGVVG